MTRRRGRRRRGRTARPRQQPEWPDATGLDRALKTIAVVSARWCSPARPARCRPSLAQVAAGNAFLLQAGDCAESFEEFSADNIREKLRVILQMAVVLTYSMGVPGREGRPHRRPVRQAPLEPDRARRRRRPAVVPRPHRQRRPVRAPPPAMPDPDRLVQAYHQSASTLNLLRAFTKGGFADLTRVHAWNQEFVASSPEGRRYEQLAGRDRPGAAVHAGLRRRHRVQPQPARGRRLHQPRGADPRLRGGAHPAGLAHRRLVRLLGPHAVDRRAHPRRSTAPTSSSSRGVGNPIGCKIGPTVEPRRGRSSCARRSTRRAIPGRLTLITPDGRRPRRGAAAAAAAGRHRRRPSGRVGVRPDARQHVHRSERPQDPPLRRHRRRDRRLRAAPTAPRARGPAASTSSSPATTSPSASAAPTRCSTPTSTTATRRCATRASTPARASTSPSASPS